MLDSEINKFHDLLINDYNVTQLKFIKAFGQDDLGVFYYKNNPYANTSQLNLYIKPFNSKEAGKDAMKFSMQVTKYINEFCSILEGHILPRLQQVDYITSVNSEDFIHQDYIYIEDKYRNIFNNTIDKAVSLYLFNMQCQLNFALYILDLLLDEHPLKYKIQFLIYYYSGQALDFAFRSGRLDELEEYKKTITGVIEKHQTIFKDNTFRNNLFYYKLTDEINISKSETPFHSMVETITSVPLENLLTIVYKEMSTVEKLITKIIY